jgi:hypothetical protein
MVKGTIKKAAKYTPINIQIPTPNRPRRLNQALITAATPTAVVKPARVEFCQVGFS